MNVQNKKHIALQCLILLGALFCILLLSPEIVRAEDDPVSAKSIEVYSGPRQIGVIEGETYVPYGVSVNVTTGNDASGYTKRMGVQVFKNGEIQEGFSYSQSDVKNGKMTETISYTEGDKTVSDSFEVDVIARDFLPDLGSDGFYEIGTPDELTAFSLMVGAAGKTDINGRLTADIDLTGTDYQPIGQYYTEARPSANTTSNCIGGSYFLDYSGTFDGNGKTVTMDLESNRCAALIGTAEGATVKNVTVDGSIQARSTGYTAVGAEIVALASSSDDEVTTIENCVNRAEINSQFTAGGIAASGGSAVKIINCTNYGDVYASGGNSGGIVGHGNAKECANYGDVSGKLSHIGGIVGTGSATSCLNMGSIEQEASKYTNVGGIIGTVSSSVYKLENCVNAGNVTGPYSVGGIAGMIDSGTKTVSNCYNYGTISCNYENNPSRYGGVAGVVGIQSTTLLQLDITGCYNLGSIVHGKGQTGAILGYTGNLPSSYPNRDTVECLYTVSDCYYIDGTAKSVIGFVGSEKNITDQSTALSIGEMIAAIQSKAEDSALPYSDTQLQVLNQFLDQENQNAADAVISRIDALGTITLNSESAVSAARNLYDALTREQKELVTNYSKLTAAETTLQTLKERQTRAEAKRVLFRTAKLSLSATTYTYTGKARTPEVTGLEGLVKNIDYTVGYRNHVKTGKATVIITGKGDCAGLSRSISFRIVPQKAAIQKLKKGKKSMQVRIASQKKAGVTGYQISYRYGKKGAFKTIVTTKTVKKIRKLKNKKYYYVKVRAYKKIDGKKYYGRYSKAKKIKVQ